MPASKPDLRGVHPRKAFPPPPPRASMAVWREMSWLDDDAAWALFLLARRVRDLADSPPTGLIRWVWGADVRRAARGLPEIADDLLLLSDERLALSESTAGCASAACQRIAAWSTEHGLGQLALHFAGAGLAMYPQSARRTYAAARTHRLVGQAPDAEVLYGRAICFARTESDWAVYVRSHLGIGLIQKHCGEYDRAAAHMATAARAAWTRSGEKWIAGMTEHDLLALQIERGNLDDALRHAWCAVERMPVHNEQLPALVHDYCVLLIERRAYSMAMALLDQVIEKIASPRHEMYVLGTLARAAAGTGDLRRYRLTETRLLELEDRIGPIAAARGMLGIGAHCLGLLEEAKEHSRVSLQIARESHDRAILNTVEPILAAAERGERGIPVPPQEPCRELRDLTARFSSRIRGWRSVAWRRRTKANRSRLWDLGND
jgi:tetratricopeptide (TPR) repeat protein